MKFFLVIFILLSSCLFSNSLNLKDYNDRLIGKTKLKKIHSNIFTKEELNYIKNAKKLKIGLGGTKPFIFIKKNKIVEGIVPDIVEEVFKIAGLKYEFLIDSRSNLLSMIKNKKLDVLPTALYSAKREKFGEFTKEYIQIHSVFFTHIDNNKIKTFGDLKDKTIAIQKDYVMLS
ncbi:MAG: transporter substrate-binding domain-containing protein, partial [Campylobacteraceae bacterium]|nr:transporter substrate-binding domain-containing protein [Campylobacteraceae bacterium]